MIDFTSPSARRAEVLGAGAIILALIVFTLWYMATHRAPEPFMAEPDVATTTLETLPPIVQEEAGTYYDVKTSYPGQTALREALSVEADQTAVTLMGRFVEDAVDEFKTQGNFDTLSAEEAAFMGLTNDRKESIQIAYEELLGENTASYVYTLYVDTLGAHPNAFYRTFTFDLKTGSELAISDLFAPGSAYLKRLSAIAEFELSKTLGDMLDIEYIRQGVTPEAINFQSYAIEGENLILIFPPYQVAPYAAGTQKVSIPLSQLAEILKPAYLPK